MPTYVNSFPGIVQLGDITFGPSAVMQLYQYLDLSKDTTNYISLTSEAPYVNPANWTHTPTSADASITLVSYRETEGVEIYNTSANLITVFLTEAANTPGIVVPANSVRYIWGFKGGVKTLAFTYGGAVTSGQFYVTEIKKYQDIELRMVS